MYLIPNRFLKAKCDKKNDFSVNALDGFWNFLNARLNSSLNWPSPSPLHSPHPHPTPYRLYKGGMRFFKNGFNGGDGKFLLEMGGSQESGGMGKFHDFYYIVGRVMVTPTILWRPSYIPKAPSLFQILSNPTRTALSVVLSVWLNGVMPHLMCYFT